MPFCPLPWTHVAIKNNGSLRLCSHSQSAGEGNTLLYKNGKPLSVAELNPETLNSDTQMQVRRDFMLGRWPEQCKRCQMEHESGKNSRNLWETVRASPWITPKDVLDVTWPDGSLETPVIRDLDIRIGNFCNLRCAMCFPGESSLWYKEYEEIFGKQTFVVDNIEYNLNEPGNFNWFDNEQNMQRLIDNCQYVNKIKFGGGEPVLIKRHKAFIKGLIERGYSRNIELEYSINVTTIPSYLIDLWKSFRRIKLCCSVDAYGQANDAIRWPSKWERIESTLNLIDSLDVNVVPFTSTTLNILSLEHYANLMLWIQSKNFKKINNPIYGPSAISHLVYNPKSLSIAILEPRQFDQIFDSIYNKVKHVRNLEVKLSEYYSLYTKIKHTDNVEASRKEFVSVFNKFQQHQNQDWSVLFPHAYQVMLDWKK
jgi:sulfatase maturation enzyme AslB (radical SAM superfamily)